MSCMRHPATAERNGFGIAALTYSQFTDSNEYINQYFKT